MPHSSKRPKQQKSHQGTSHGYRQYLLIAFILIFTLLIIRLLIDGIRRLLDRRCRDIIKTKPTSARSHPDDHGPIPVWYWWEGAESKCVACAVRSWHEQLPSSKYKITRVNLSNIQEHISPGRYEAISCLQTSAEMKALQSDMARLALLEHNGGIYMDATVFLFDDLDWISATAGYDFQAYFNPLNTRNCRIPCIENPFLYARHPNNPLIKEWLDEMQEINVCSLSAVRDWMVREKITKHAPFLELEYHAAYHALARCIERNGGIEAFDGVYLMNAVSHHFFVYLDTLPKHAIALVKPGSTRAMWHRNISHDIRKPVVEHKVKVRKLIGTERKQLDAEWTDAMCDEITAVSRKVTAPWIDPLQEVGSLEYGP